MLVFRHIDLDDTPGDLGVDIHVVQGFQSPGSGNGLPQIPPLYCIGPGGRHGFLGLFDLVVLVAAGSAGNQDCQDNQQHFMLLHDVHAVFPPSSSCRCRKKHGCTENGSPYIRSLILFIDENIVRKKYEFPMKRF